MSEHASGSLSTSLEFAYQPLDDPSKEFRLLRVLAERCDDCIQVQMWNCSRPSKIIVTKGQSDYRCLSYMWGDPTEMHEFLSYAAQSIPMQNLWIDALSIDQSNVSEKNLQVSRMGSIYAEANGVLLWLGNDHSLLPFARYVSSEAQVSETNSEATISASYAAFWDNPYWTRTCEPCLNHLSGLNHVLTFHENSRRDHTRAPVSEINPGSRLLLQHRLARNPARPKASHARLSRNARDLAWCDGQSSEP
jgi:hypothetical protein